ncbi:MAG: hypothetical protein E7080_09780 [Bacteroidales bacterium]|nr:hypothetical protein [Bacteroidales bacterium]
MQENYSIIGRWLLSLASGIVAMLQPTLPYFIICTLFIFADCFTAWRLDKRVAIAHPNKVRKGIGGKFKSSHFAKVLFTLIKCYVLIILAFLVDVYIVRTSAETLTRIAAGSILGWQMWSILENESSCNGSRWAKLAQKILVDKTERHFGIDLSDLENNPSDLVNDIHNPLTSESHEKD